MVSALATLLGSFLGTVFALFVLAVISGVLNDD
jgi:hypothetical protein